MANTPRRVVITGLGVLSPVGLTAEAFYQGLLAGQSGVRPIRSFDVSTCPVKIGAEIENFEPKNYIDKKERKNLRVMARANQLVVAGSQLALDDAKIDKNKIDPTRFGIDFGSGLLPMEANEIAAAAHESRNGKPLTIDLKVWGEKGLPLITPLWMLKFLPNMLACHVSILHNAQGPSNSITEGEVGSLLAMGEALRILRRDQADLFLAGGADSKTHPLTFIRQTLFRELSKRNDAPEAASRPFSKGRDGTVLGEGTGVLLLEKLEHAQARGASILAEIVGFSSAFDPGMKGLGLARAIRSALKQANIEAKQLDHVNAHGLSSPGLDAWEARNIREAVGDVPVWAIKGNIGNAAAGAGTLELAGSVLALRHGTIPGTINYDADPDCPLRISKESRPVKEPYALKVGFTESGQCAAAVIKKWE